MPVVRLTAHHVRIPLKRRVRHASHVRDSTDSLIIRCELSDGSIGWGEGLPREYVTGETIDDAWNLLQSTELAEQLSSDLPDLESAIDRLSRLTIDASRLSTLNSRLSTLQRECFGNAIRCAIEIAVLDAVCRRTDVPLSHVTTLLPETEPLRQQVAEVRYSGMITAESPAMQLHSALKQRVYGFRQIKVKVGVPGMDDASVLRRIRRIVGPRVELRIDANEAWSCEELLDRLGPLSALSLSCVEQPVPNSEVGGLASVRSQLRVPVMLDESMCSEADARQAIENGLCDAFNIRLSKCGGFLPSLRIAALARRAGLGYQLGCQVGETGILSAAGRHFATSVGGLSAVEGSYDRHLVGERLTDQDVTFGYGGRAPALAGPGLGVQVDLQALQRVTCRALEIIRR